MLLMLLLYNVQLLLRILDLRFQPRDLLLVGFFAFLQLAPKAGQFLHSLLDL